MLGLNLEATDRAPGSGPAVNGSLVELSFDELDRLDLREMRYDRIEVTEAIRCGDELPLPATIFAYVAKPANLQTSPRPQTVVLASYLERIEAAFESLGPGELGRYRASTLPIEVEVVAATLVHDAIPPGNPRDW